MEHTNLFLYENNPAMQTDYPNGKVDTPVPGVAYARASENSASTVIYNEKKTFYTVTLTPKNRSGATIGQTATTQTPETMEGSPVKVNIVATEIEEYKPVAAIQKIEVSADTTYDVLYNSLTSYTITVHHMYEGSAITADTTVVVNDVYETERVSVVIVPESVQGYQANTVTITVSASCEYTLEYIENSYEAVDLGLESGTLWANKNVGANAPEEFGNFYAWGEITPKSANEFTVENYRFYGGSESVYTKYNDEDELWELALADDAANAEMGGDWHIPTLDQCYELLEGTTSAFTSVNGVSGIRLTSIANGNSIFFPFAGMKGIDIPAGYSVFGVWQNNFFYDEYDEPQVLSGFEEYNSDGGVNVYDMLMRWGGASVRGVIGSLVPNGNGNDEK